MATPGSTPPSASLTVPLTRDVVTSVWAIAVPARPNTRRAATRAAAHLGGTQFASRIGDPPPRVVAGESSKSLTGYKPCVHGRSSGFCVEIVTLSRGAD